MAATEDFRSRKIRVFRNGDVFAPGKKLVVSPRVYRNYEQFLHNISLEINLLNGAVRRVYTLDGRAVRGLSDLCDGQSYVATGGELFKHVAYRVLDDDAGAAPAAARPSDAQPPAPPSYLRPRPLRRGPPSFAAPPPAAADGHLSAGPQIFGP
ncbi:Doublecortin domain-containing protein 2B, partial [Cladochytrium tenue]